MNLLWIKRDQNISSELHRQTGYKLVSKCFKRLKYLSRSSENLSVAKMLCWRLLKMIEPTSQYSHSAALVVR